MTNLVHWGPCMMAACSAWYKLYLSYVVLLIDIMCAAAISLLPRAHSSIEAEIAIAAMGGDWRLDD